MRDLRMYILVNEDIKINKGKLAGQVGHAVNVLTYRYCNGDEERQNTIDEYMEGEIKKIVLFDSQNHLEELESKGHIRIRDKGYTDLEPNTLTCINLGIIDYNNIPEDLNWIKTLKLVR